VGRSQPAACDPLFRSWRSAGQLTPELAWQRVELAIAAKQPRLARYLRRFLPASDQRWLDLWLALRSDPSKIGRYPQLRRDHPRAGQLTTYAMTRLGLRDEQKAAELWSKIQEFPGLDSSQKGAIIRAIALGMATSHHRQAHAWLSRVPAAQRDKTVQEWRIRVALRQFDWPAVLAYIGALPTPQRTKLRWRYWRARALEGLDQQDAATAIYQALAEYRNYYGFLAADRLGLSYNLQHHPVIDDPISQAALSQLPAILRARELHQLQRLHHARQEWQLATRALPEEDLQQAARLAQSWGWDDQAIRTISRSAHRDDVNLRFPLGYQALITTAATTHKIAPAWAFAIARKESLFTPDARSRVGALGLMQLMPKTGRRVARSLGRPLRSSRELLNPATNVQLGSAYLAQLMARYNHPVLATAAYNAGPHNVERWLPDQLLPADIWIETISYGETRDYLAGVMAFTAVYVAQLGDTPIRLSDLMVNIVKPRQ